MVKNSQIATATQHFIAEDDFLIVIIGLMSLKEITLS
jgi:hypothetical protein